MLCENQTCLNTCSSIKFKHTCTVKSNQFCLHCCWIKWDRTASYILEDKKCPNNQSEHPQYSKNETLNLSNGSQIIIEFRYRIQIQKCQH